MSRRQKSSYHFEGTNNKENCANPHHKIQYPNSLELDTFGWRYPHDGNDIKNLTPEKSSCGVRP